MIELLTTSTQLSFAEQIRNETRSRVPKSCTNYENLKEQILEAVRVAAAEGKVETTISAAADSRPIEKPVWLFLAQELRDMGLDAVVWKAKAKKESRPYVSLRIRWFPDWEEEK